jgi:hypothetical protein
MMRAVPLVGVLAFSLVGCSLVPALDQAARQAIAAEAAALLAATPPGEGPATAVPQAEWPTKIRSLEPQNVRVDAIGLYMAMGSIFAEERGYFVPRNEAAFSPMAGGDPSYRSLGDGVYWYEVKG